MHANAKPVITKQEVEREKARHHPITSTQSKSNPPVQLDHEITYCANLNCLEDWPCTAYRLCEWYEATLVKAVAPSVEPITTGRTGKLH